MTRIILDRCCYRTVILRMSIHIKENGESSAVMVQMQMRMKLMSAEYEKIDKENSALRLQLHELLDGRYLFKLLSLRQSRLFKRYVVIF